MEDRFVICSLGKNLRLVGSSECFIFQVLEVENWTDKYYWYCIRDVINGYMRYMVKHKLRNQDDSGIMALMQIMQQIDEKIDEVSEDLTEALKNDPVE